MDNDKEMREKLSKALGAGVDHTYGRAIQSVYSWEEIFTEIGKLLERASRSESNIKYSLYKDKETGEIKKLCNKSSCNNGVDNSIDTTCR